MEKPQSVIRAVNIIWLLIAANIFVTLLNQWLGLKSSGEFIFLLFAYGVYCMIPYKLNARSNAARYVYSILVAISVLMLLGGVVDGMTKLDLAVSIMTTPIHLFSIYLLFTKQSNNWFNQSQTRERIEPRL